MILPAIGIMQLLSVCLMESQQEYFARQRLHAGNEYPYDASDEWRELYSSSRQAPPPFDWAHAAARGIVADLQDRRAIKDGFNRVDEEVRTKIVKAIAEIIRQAEIQYR
jgi:hypothetical protein